MWAMLVACDGSGINWSCLERWRSTHVPGCSGFLGSTQATRTAGLRPVSDPAMSKRPRGRPRKGALSTFTR